MKVGVLIPDRGDRAQFTQNCFRMMAAQTLKPEAIVHVMDPPANDKCDITFRYRKGYEMISKFMSVDLIALIENDDWYSPDYLETMARLWNERGRPDIFGTNYTIYYHLGLRAYHIYKHDNRASAMNTFIKPGLTTIVWPKDDEPYTDLHLWDKVKGMTLDPGHVISVGMKHGIGKVGGEFHTTRLRRYTNADDGFLESTLDKESFSFYQTIMDQLK